MNHLKRVAVMLLPWLLFTNSSAASLIGDEVMCDYSVSFGLSFAGECSTSMSAYQPGTAIVNDLGPLDAEFYIGLPLNGSFFFGGSIDVGADYIAIDPDPVVSIGRGFFRVEISSLDWLNSPTGIITDALLSGVDLDGGQVQVSHTDNSVTIVFRDFLATENTLARIDLITSDSSVPVPSSLALSLLGVVLLLRRKARAGKSPCD